LSRLVIGLWKKAGTIRARRIEEEAVTIPRLHPARGRRGAYRRACDDRMEQGVERRL